MRNLDFLETEKGHYRLKKGYKSLVLGKGLGYYFVYALEINDDEITAL